MSWPRFRDALPREEALSRLFPRGTSNKGRRASRRKHDVACFLFSADGTDPTPEIDICSRHPQCRRAAVRGSRFLRRREPPVRVHGAPLLSGGHAVVHRPDGRPGGRPGRRPDGRLVARHGGRHGGRRLGRRAGRRAVRGRRRGAVGHDGGGVGGGRGGGAAGRHGDGHGDGAPAAELARLRPGQRRVGAGRRDDQHGVALGGAHAARGGHGGDGLRGGLLGPPQQFSLGLADLATAPPLLARDVAQCDGDEHRDGDRHADAHPDDLLVEAAVVAAW